MTQPININGRIGVLMGGSSSEREISLISGQAVFDALTEVGLNVIPVVIGESTEEEIYKFIKNLEIDAAFIALHGGLGEDGRIQAILERAQVAYAGSGIQASRICIDKVLTQNILKSNDVSVPEFTTVLRSDPDHAVNIFNRLESFPLVVKPAREGSSFGVSIVRHKDELDAAIKKAFSYGEKILLEDYIKGRELTVGIIDQTALPVVEIVSNNEFYDFNAKYDSDQTQYIVPADIPEFLAETLKKVAHKAHKCVGCRDFSRVDFIVDEDFNHYVLEINTIPGFTPKSLLPKAAAELGINFNLLCTKLMELAYAKKEKKESISVRT